MSGTVWLRASQKPNNGGDYDTNDPNRPL